MWLEDAACNKLAELALNDVQARTAACHVLPYCLGGLQ